MAAGGGVVWFAAEHPVWAAAVAGLLAVLFAGALILRRRAIEAGRRRFLAANAELEKVDLMSGREFEHLVAAPRAAGMRSMGGPRRCWGDRRGPRRRGTVPCPGGGRRDQGCPSGRTAPPRSSP
ncbi:hypothetical protein [Nonomuraea coxensis]|uniref:hypothetical protein n=1 Tax=Nonomuraea coxensis TaxID=404386 RepID=UPI0003A0A5BE|nr:hypothetical protein [Nonomuraea coxensis]